jgi:predicted dehydrogenase
MVRIALLGAWHVHTRGFVDRLHKSGEGRVTVVWDEDGPRGKACAEAYGIPFEPSLDAVLGRPGIDAVMVEAPTVRHAEIIVRAAAAGKHVFSDKALAPRTAECEQIKKALEAGDLTFVVSMEAKTNAPYRYAEKLIDAGTLGRVTSAYFRRDHGAALERFLPDYWYDTRQTGGGVTIDLGCHGFYLLNQFCGVPRKITSVMNGLYGTGADENSTTVIEFENGAIGTAHTSFVSWKMDNLLEIIGTEGMLVAAGTGADNYRVLLQSKRLPAYQVLSPVPASEYGEDDVLPIVSFARLINNGEKNDKRYDIDRAITLTRIIERAYESARTGKTIAY